ncbi:lysophospholipase 1 [Zygosaccharomyces mellis]|uniref:Lysophospholipase n=1 Tax=Zygosaccharomyces mellis TaxID=42258 RepID=A0A4C2E456_9SACH|nr:lysophospholipase 1 [Zygosaccharomyces mellis]
MFCISYLVVLLGFLQAIAFASKHSSTSSTLSTPTAPSAKNLSNGGVDHGYAPRTIKCPSNETSFLREAQGLSSKEKEWLEKREVLVSESLRQFMLQSWRNFTNATETVNQLFPVTNASHHNNTKSLKFHNEAHRHHNGHVNNTANDTASSRNNGSSSDQDLYSLVPKIGIAASGGSYRAMFSGAGMLAAMDNRTMGSVEHGLGGLLQGSSYLVGSSGGAWLVGTLVGNNWISVQNIVDGMKSNNSVWDISHSLGNIGGYISNSSGMQWLESVRNEVNGKKAAGFPLSLSDYLGHAMAYELFPLLPHGAANYTVSDIRNLKAFQEAQMPFPLILAQYKTPNQTNNPLNSTIFEFNPYEMGSWDQTLNGFTDVKYLGTNVSDGSPVHQDSCVVGFDNYGFVLGTSASLSNVGISPQAGNSPLQNFFGSSMNNETSHVAEYSPNPFKNAHFGPKNGTVTKGDSLQLVDGGEDGQVIPFVPLLQKERDLDVIFTLDNSAVTSNSWPDGSSLVDTYERQFGEMGKNIAFPPVPDLETFEKEKLNQRITFFGCDDQELKNLSHTPPLIVYVPNAQHSFASNTSTYQVSYSENERLSMIKNGFEAATMGNLTQDSNFGGCIACAVAKRKQESKNISLPKECDACFSKYCWRGPVAPNVTIWNSSSEAKLGFGAKNLTTNITWNATTWKPFGNATVNLTAIIDQDHPDSKVLENKKHDDFKVDHFSKRNSATGLSVNMALVLASLVGLMIVAS